jgi:hypothetical protein
MFERYTEPSRRVVFYSRYMAAQAGSPKIETEHLLVGLLRADMVLARRFLGSPWAAEEIWREVERKKPVRAAIPAGVDLPLSPKHSAALSASEYRLPAAVALHPNLLLSSSLEKAYPEDRCSAVILPLVSGGPK